VARSTNGPQPQEEEIGRRPNFVRAHFSAAC
jgi:hypothetical protein